MSEERLERIENSIGQLVQVFTTMQQDMSTLKQDMTTLRQDMSTLKQDLTATNQNVNALSEDLSALRNRVESIEGTVIVAIRSSHTSLRDYLDDLNFEMSESQRKYRLLNRRVKRLERKDSDDD